MALSTWAAPTATDNDDGAGAKTSASIQRLPREVLLQILACINEPRDLNAFLCANKGNLAIAADPVLAAIWHRPSKALLLAAEQKKGDVMLRMLNMGVSPTAKISAGAPIGPPVDAFGNLIEILRSPLEIAVQHEQLQVVEFLWGMADVRADLKGACMALFQAAKQGLSEVVQLLLAPPLSPLTVDNIDKTIKNAVVIDYEMCMISMAVHPDVQRVMRRFISPDWKFFEFA